MSEDATRLIKRRRIIQYSLDELEASIPAIPIATLHGPSNANISIPNTMSLPAQLAFANTPQDLVFSVLTGNKTLYTKQEVLLLIDKLTKMISPQFVEDASYIS